MSWFPPCASHHHFLFWTEETCFEPFLFHHSVIIINFASTSQVSALLIRPERVNEKNISRKSFWKVFPFSGNCLLKACDWQQQATTMDLLHWFIFKRERFAKLRLFFKNWLLIGSTRQSLKLFHYIRVLQNLVSLYVYLTSEAALYVSRQQSCFAQHQKQLLLVWHPSWGTPKGKLASDHDSTNVKCAACKWWPMRTPKGVLRGCVLLRGVSIEASNMEWSLCIIYLNHLYTSPLVCADREC